MHALCLLLLLLPAHAQAARVAVKLVDTPGPAQTYSSYSYSYPTYTPPVTTPVPAAPVPKAAEYAGPRLLRPLRDQCLQSESGRYRIQWCGFHNVTQARLEGGYPPVSLGLFAGFISPNILNFADGAACSSGARRTTNVTLHCGSRLEIMSYDEPRGCQYLLEVAAPAACILTAEGHLAEGMDSAALALSRSISERVQLLVRQWQENVDKISSLKQCLEYVIGGERQIQDLECLEILNSVESLNKAETEPFSAGKSFEEPQLLSTVPIDGVTATSVDSVEL